MRPDVAAPPRLLDAQRALAGALRELDAGTSLSDRFEGPARIAVADRLAVYRNNARQFFRAALALTYPVLQRRVGEDFFRQLATEYRGAHPSRSGDLHWVGAEFPAWLEIRLHETEYAWLADLARLEWACEEAAAAATEAPVTLQCLAAIPPESVDGVRLRLQPSLRLVASRWPVWSVWSANQVEGAGPVDLTAGAEHCACIGTTDAGVAVFRLGIEAYGLLAELRQDASLADALSRTGTTPDGLAKVLEWAFAHELVVEVSPSAPA
ncbi:MAG TPA: DNA-binding domain-containing protein [Steroidobacteraceae bacterium]|nr:DNA-binding domain-containing protein [Steroidobacteraceae bacterium]